MFSALLLINSYHDPRANYELIMNRLGGRRPPATNCKRKFFLIVAAVHCESQAGGRWTVDGGSHPCLRCAYTVSDARCHLKAEGERYYGIMVLWYSPRICKSSERRPSTIKQYIQQTASAAVSVSSHTNRCPTPARRTDRRGNGQTN